MSEINKEHNLEAEIAELNREIEIKRAELEQEKGIVEEREAVSEVVASHVYASDTSTQAVSPAPSSANYLDNLDADTVVLVNNLISDIPKAGIKKTIARARAEHPFVLDAFHDALVTKLYEELKERGLIA